MNREPQNENLPNGQMPATEAKDAPSAKEKAFSILSGVFFGIAVAVILVMIYVNTAKNLTVSPFLSPILILILGWGVGLGMLFRTLKNERENVSSINYFFKIALSVLVLLYFLLTFLTGILKVLT